MKKAKKQKSQFIKNGVLFKGFESEAKRYVLDNGDKVTGKQLINYLQTLNHNEKRKNESKKKLVGITSIDHFGRKTWATSGTIMRGGLTITNYEMLFYILRGNGRACFDTTMLGDGSLKRHKRLLLRNGNG